MALINVPQVKRIKYKHKSRLMDVLEYMDIGLETEGIVTDNDVVYPINTVVTITKLGVATYNVKGVCHDGSLHTVVVNPWMMIDCIDLHDRSDQAFLDRLYIQYKEM